MRNLRIWGSIGYLKFSHNKIHMFLNMLMLKSNLLLKSLVLQDDFHSQLFNQSKINLLYIVLPLLLLLLGALVEMLNHQATGGRSRNQQQHLHQLQNLKLKMMKMKKTMLRN
jgi:hypothetical protein